MWTLILGSFYDRWLSKPVVTLGAIFMDAITALKFAQMGSMASVT